MKLCYFVDLAGRYEMMNLLKVDRPFCVLKCSFASRVRIEKKYIYRCKCTTIINNLTYIWGCKIVYQPLKGSSSHIGLLNQQNNMISLCSHLYYCDDIFWSLTKTIRMLILCCPLMLICIFSKSESL